MANSANASGVRSSTVRVSSEFGSLKGGWGRNGELTQNSVPATDSAVDATITLPASQASGYTLTVQFTHSDGTVLAHSVRFPLYIFADTAPLALATTGGSTGIAAGASGVILKTVTAKLIFDCLTDATGKSTFTWTDNASETAYVGVLTPAGRIVMCSGNLLAT